MNPNTIHYQKHFDSLPEGKKRNKRCRCGKDKKYKRCCLGKQPMYSEDELKEIFVIPRWELLRIAREYNSGFWRWVFRNYYRIWNRIFSKRRKNGS